MMMSVQNYNLERLSNNPLQWHDQVPSQPRITRPGKNFVRENIRRLRAQDRINQRNRSEQLALEALQIVNFKDPPNLIDGIKGTTVAYRDTASAMRHLNSQKFEPQSATPRRSSNSSSLRSLHNTSTDLELPTPVVGRQINLNTSHPPSSGSTFESGDALLDKEASPNTKPPKPPEKSRFPFLKAHTRSAGSVSELEQLGSQPIKTTRTLLPPSADRRLTVPRASSVKDVRMVRRDINFVRANAHLASKPPSRPCSARRSCSSLLDRSSFSPLPLDGGSDNNSNCIQGTAVRPVAKRRTRIGEVPRYLIQRRIEVERIAAEEEANRRDPDQPEGHVRMPEAERLDTLNLLHRAYSDLCNEQARLPLRMDTLRVRTRRDDIESRLVELEHNIAIFAKPRVYIKPD